MATNRDWAAKRLSYDAYTVGWTAVLNTELETSRLLLDEEHELLPSGEKDSNNYILGRMGMHNVAIAFPGSGADTYAAEMMENMLRTFRNIRFGLLVGVGGGAPVGFIVWQPYAAVAAAAYAKDLLRVAKPNEVAALPTVVDIFTTASKPSLEDQVAELELQLKQLRSELSELANKPAPEPPKEIQFESGKWMSVYEPPKVLEHRITFTKKYTSVPVVIASISSGDLDKAGNFRLNVEVKSVDLEGFELKVMTWGDTKVYSVGVQWAAFGN
ncbi:uncharacterized protein DFL_003754 [Arthrobotrys flagrans]|uniref:H-type lectin domain-containing protein n=1 Tax=Arthrobotrys flagrans TaxID=97331 RepID=A0A437A2R6_ARTFL|nr:hypothetical protein DFL_003754 [Arthrobotrys flagrans]